jgi:hypothetical protein
MRTTYMRLHTDQQQRTGGRAPRKAHHPLQPEASKVRQDKGVLTDVSAVVAIKRRGCTTSELVN